jgi:hypothetical protein
MKKYILDRIGSKFYGTIGVLFEEVDQELVFKAVTLEPVVPVIPVGVYLCKIYKEGRHLYPVFQVMDVPGHTYIEIHIGNWKKDTTGCILLGDSFSLVGNEMGINGSKITFNSFMGYQGDENFKLEVR